MTWLLLAQATDGGGAGLPSLAVYGVAAFPMALMLYAIRYQHQELTKKSEAIDKLNERLQAQGDLAIKQAERLAPLINDASRVLTQALDELGQTDLGRGNRR